MGATMNIIRLGTRFINLDRVIDADICLDEFGNRAILLRYVVADATASANALMALKVEGTDAEALEAYLNECGVILTATDPLPLIPCDTMEGNDTPLPTILDL